MIFPESAWNISENESVMKLFPSAAAMALESGADIVPTAVEKYKDTYYVVIGKELQHTEFADRDAKRLTAELCDLLATLKWEIWTHYGIHPRPDNSDEYRKNFSLFESVLGYTLQDVIETRYHDKP